MVGGRAILKTGRIEKNQDQIKKNVRADVEEEDEEESYYRWLVENPEAGKPQVGRKKKVGSRR